MTIGSKRKRLDSSVSGLTPHPDFDAEDSANAEQVVVSVQNVLRGTAFLYDWSQLVRRDIQENIGGLGTSPPPTCETGDTRSHVYTHFTKNTLAGFADGYHPQLRQTSVKVVHERGRTEDPEDEVFIVKSLRTQRIAKRKTNVDVWQPMPPPLSPQTNPKYIAESKVSTKPVGRQGYQAQRGFPGSPETSRTHENTGRSGSNGPNKTPLKPECVIRQLDPDVVLQVPYVEPLTGAPVVYKQIFVIEQTAFTESISMLPT
jgi:hypothetical protein